MANLPNALRPGASGHTSPPALSPPRRTSTAETIGTLSSGSYSSHNGALPASLRANTLDRPAPTRSDTSDSRLSDLLSSPGARRKSSTTSVSTMHTDAPYLPSRYGSVRRDVSPPEADFDNDDDFVARRSSWAPTRASSVSSKYAALPSLPALPSAADNDDDTNPFIISSPQRRASGGGGVSQLLERSRSRGIMNRLGSARAGRGVPRGRYGQLHDLDEEAADHEDIGIDISGMDGGPMIEMYDVSKASGVYTTSGSLGGGMGHVLNASLKPSMTIRHKRGDANMTPDLRVAIQHEAQKQGEIVAVEEEIFDLGLFEGGEQKRSNTSLEQETATEMKKSYFFPEDPDKPAWKPVSMRWPYITLLIVIAFFLAGLQEFLCQIGSRNKDGLLKFKNAKSISIVHYFTWKYLPTMVLVIYGVMWQVVDYEVKRLEPYYQLSKREGATAWDSLNLDYLTAFAYFIPVRAIRRKQWAVVFSSLSSLIAGTLLAVLQSAAVETNPKRPREHPDQPVIVLMDPVFSRFLTSALCIVAISGIALVWSLRRTSGLLSDPKGIAGVASMATKSHILADFKDLDTASNSVIHDRLRKRRYNLHKSSLWQGEFVRESDNLPPPDKEENPQPIMLRLVAGLPYMFYILLVAALLPIFLFNPQANVVTAKIPWLLTALATGVKLGWGAIDIELRVMEPYYILWRRHAPPKTLTLDYTGTVPGYLTVKAIINRHWVIALVSFGAILTEALTVCASSFTVDGRKFVSDDDVSGVETFRSFWISFTLANVIFLYLLVVASIVYLKRGHKILPRQPGSIAGVLAYIHQSRMLDDFIDTELKDSTAMTRHLEQLGKTYALGWFNGRDKEDHCGVEQEAIAAAYKYGVAWNKSRMVGTGVGNWEHY